MQKKFYTGTFDLTSAETTYLSPIPWVLIQRGNRVIVRKKQAIGRPIPQHTIMFHPVADADESVTPLRVQATGLLLRHINELQLQQPDKPTQFRALLMTFGYPNRQKAPTVVHVRPC